VAGEYNEPSIRFPLASSYNERFSLGKTSAVTNSQDQRKINCQYDSADNPATGKQTLYLTKRPGVVVHQTTLNSSTVATSDVPYLAIIPPGGSIGSIPWVFVFDGTNTKAADGSSGATISTDSNYPKYVDKTLISGTETVVFQTGAKTFFASVVDSWTEITDSDFPLTPAGKIEFIDGYAFATQDTDSYVYNSDLNSISSWTPGNRIKKQIQQDFPIGQIRHGQTLLVFGTASVEGFYNAGNPTGSPLKRIPQISDFRIGISTGGEGSVSKARHYYASLSGLTYFVGREGGSVAARGVYVFDGARFEKVSSVFVDKILVETGFSHIQAISYYGKNAIAIAIDEPTASTQRWLMFFPEHKAWFEWTSTRFQPVGSGTYFVGLPNATARNLHFFAARNIDAISYANTWQDGSTAYTMQTQFKLPDRGPRRKSMRWAGVLADKASSTSNLSVEFSDDDYATWTTARDIDLSTDDKRIVRCGAYKDRAVRLSHSANSDCRIEAFVARSE
jgi:hypothetical protein